MGAFQNIGVSDYLKRYGWKYGIQRGAFTAFPFHVVNDYENKKILYYSKVEKKLKKKYLKSASIDPEGLKFGTIEVDNPIWVYWKQGLDQAPAIVKSCINSIKKNADTEVVVITDDNAEQYVKFPTYIMEKLAKGTMSTAAFSDLLRFSLLEHYGGTWIDSTVYLTDPIPDMILNSDFFAVRNSLLLIDNPVLYPAWFLHAKKGNKTIREIRNVAFAYWLKNEHVIEYLLPNLIITLVVKSNPEVEKAIPYMNSDYSEYLVKVLAEDYSEEKWNWIKKLTGIHKLTYKLDADIKHGHNFYDYLITSSDEKNTK